APGVGRGARLETKNRPSGDGEEDQAPLRSPAMLRARVDETTLRGTEDLAKVRKDLISELDDWLKIEAEPVLRRAIAERERGFQDLRSLTVQLGQTEAIYHPGTVHDHFVALTYQVGRGLQIAGETAQIMETARRAVNAELNRLAEVLGVSS